MGRRLDQRPLSPYAIDRVIRGFQFLDALVGDALADRTESGGMMKRHLVVACLLSLGVFLAGCDKAPPSTPQQSAEAETPEKKATDLMKRAERGDAEAQDQLGVMYAKGEGVPKDEVKAFEWYQKAAA